MPLTKNIKKKKSKINKLQRHKLKINNTKQIRKNKFKSKKIGNISGGSYGPGFFNSKNNRNNRNSSKLSDEILDYIDRLKKNNPDLKQIIISKNNIDNKGAKAIAYALKQNTILETLCISKNDIGDAGAKEFADALKQNTNLEKFDIGHNNIGDEGAIALASALEQNTKLTDFYIDYNNISDEGATAIAKALSTNSTLTVLVISNNNIGDEGATAIAKALSTNSTLTVLVISNNNIGDEGAKAIAIALQNNSTLTILNISNNNIGDEGATAIAEVLNISNLTKLIISNNNISDDIYKQIHDAFKSRLTLIIFEPDLTPSNLPLELEELLDFIKRNLKKFIKDKELKLNNSNKFDIINKYILYLTLNVDNFYGLIKNNYESCQRSLETIKTSEKYIIDLHGKILKNIFRLPDNVNIIFLSPIRYMTCISLSHTTKIILNISKYINEYLENPYCFDNAEITKIFSESIIYYGGQYCIDLDLTRDVINNLTGRIDHVTGLHYINYDKKIMDSYKYGSGILNDMTLSKFLVSEYDHKGNKFNNPDIKYTIILTSCRESLHLINEYEYISSLTEDILVFYEKSLQLLNFKVYYMNDENKSKRFNNNNDANYDANYVKCSEKINRYFRVSGIENNTVYHRQLIRNPITNNNTHYKGLFMSRKNISITNETKISNTDTAGDLKKKVVELKDNKEKLFEDLLKYLHVNLNRSNESIYITEKKLFDLIKYIFYGNYDLMFEFLVKLENSDYYVNFDYFKEFIKDFDLSKIDYQINLSAFKFIVKYLNLQNLKKFKLDIFNHNIGDEGAFLVIDVLKQNKELAYLNMSINNIGNEGAIALASALEQNKELEYLNMSINNIGNEGVVALASALEQNNELTYLDLSNNNIGDEGVKALASALEKIKKLEYLKLSNNNIGNEGVIALARSLNKTLLTYLNISINKYGGGMMEDLAVALEKNTILKELVIGCNPNSNLAKGEIRIAEALVNNKTLTKLIIKNYTMIPSEIKIIYKLLENNKLLKLTIKDIT